MSADSMETIRREARASLSRSQARRGQRPGRHWTWWLYLLLVVVIVGALVGTAVYLIVIL